MTNNFDGSIWTQLMALDGDARERSMREQFASILALDNEERDQAIGEMVEAEYELDDSALREFTRSRLRCWIGMARSDMDSARQIAHGYDVVFDRLPAAMAMRRAQTVQAVARTDLGAEDVDVLFELIPSVVQQLPRSKHLGLEKKGAHVRSRPWWMFWSRFAGKPAAG